MIKLFTKKRNKRGFTLIELIVVVAILGILAAIAIPRFSGVTASAQTNADKATARTILSAITMAEADQKVTGYPAETAAQSAFMTSVNKSLNDAVTYGNTDPDNTATNWTINYETSKWVVYKDAKPVTP